MDTLSSFLIGQVCQGQISLRDEMPASPLHTRPGAMPHSLPAADDFGSGMGDGAFLSCPFQQNVY